MNVSSGSRKIPTWKISTRKIPTHQIPLWKIPSRETPTQEIPTWNIPTHALNSKLGAVQ